MRKFNESLLGSALTICLGLIWVVSFVPQGYPAAWLALAMLLSLGILATGVARAPDAVARPAALLAGAFVIYAMLFALLVLFHGGAARELDKPVRFVVAALVLLGAVRVPLRERWMIGLLVAATATAFGYALFARLVNGEIRVGWFANPIQFGVMAVATSLLCTMLALGLPAQRARERRWLAVGALSALCAAVLSGSLTAMLAIVSLPFLVLYAWGNRYLRRGVVAASFLALATLVGVTGARGTLADRITSNASRLENFSSALSLFKAAPVAGVGRDGFVRLREQARVEGKLSDYTAGFNVAHSEYLDTLAKRGLVGFAGLLGLFLVPGYLFATRMRTGVGSQRAWAGAGLAATTTFALASLTQNVITHGSGSNMMAATLTICLCMALQRPEAARTPAPA